MKPIFVLGNPRSGTTLLRLMLTCHRNIVIPPEAGFAAWLFERHAAWTGPCASRIDAFVADVVATRKFETWGLGESDLRQFLRQREISSYAEAVSLVYQLYGLRQGRTFTRWGDKNNFYVDYIDVLNRMFPAAQFVHVVRDGRDVACSYRGLAGREIHSRYAPKLPVEIAAIAAEWSANTEKVRHALAELGARRGTVVRFEDLVSDPEAALRKLCDFLGEDFDRSMLDYHRRNADGHLEPEEFLQWKERTLTPPSDSRTEVYRRELDPASVAAFEAIAGGALRHYGYLP